MIEDKLEVDNDYAGNFRDAFEDCATKTELGNFIYST